jgi:hypothetical protein
MLSIKVTTCTPLALPWFLPFFAGCAGLLVGVPSALNSMFRFELLITLVLPVVSAISSTSFTPQYHWISHPTASLCLYSSAYIDKLYVLSRRSRGRQGRLRYFECCHILCATSGLTQLNCAIFPPLQNFAVISEQCIAAPFIVKTGRYARQEYYTCFATLTTARTTSPYNTQLHYYSTCRKITFSVPWAGEKHVFLGLSRDCHNSVEHLVHYIFSPLDLRYMGDML